MSDFLQKAFAAMTPLLGVAAVCLVVASFALHFRLGKYLVGGIKWFRDLEPAAGRIKFGDTKLRNQSFDCDAPLQIARPNGWPERSEFQGQWCHSDLKDAAFFYVFKFYEKAIEKGDLK